MIAHTLRRLSLLLARAADRVDPPPVGDIDAHLEQALQRLAHVKAGRIRRRRGESTQAFALRVVRGEFELVSPVIDLATERARRSQIANRAESRR